MAEPHRVGVAAVSGWPREHRLRDPHLDMDELGRRISQRLGFPIAVVSQPAVPGVDGIVRFERMGTATDSDIEEVLVDPRTVVSTIDAIAVDREESRSRATKAWEQQAAFTNPNRGMDSLQACLDAADAANSVDGQLVAVLAWMRRELAAAQAFHQQ